MVQLVVVLAGSAGLISCAEMSCFLMAKVDESIHYVVGGFGWSAFTFLGLFINYLVVLFLIASLFD